MDYKNEIIGLLNKIKNDDILRYIYMMTLDIAKEEKKNN